MRAGPTARPQVRFSYLTPSVFQSLWAVVRYRSDWKAQCPIWVIDNDLREKFRLNDDEEALMETAAESMYLVARRDRVAHLRMRSFWPDEKMLALREHILTAISDRRRGDPREWDRLSAMDTRQWIDWVQVRRQANPTKLNPSRN